MGNSIITGDQAIVNTDNISFDGTRRAGAMNADGQLWIGSATSNRPNNGGHVRLGSLTSPDGSVTIGYSAPNITLQSGAKDLHTSQFIVNSSGTTGTGANFTTIAAAIAAAQGTGIPQTVFIMPGSTGIYTENLTLVPNINLTAFQCDSSTPNVTISGTLTLTAAGSVSISGIRLQTNSAALLAVTGTLASKVNLKSCYLNCTNNSGITLSSSSASSEINLFQCQGNIGTTGINLFGHSGAGLLLFQDCIFTNTGSSLTAATVSGSGGLQVLMSTFNFNITTSSTSSCLIYDSIIQPSTLNITALTLGGSGNQSVFNTEIASGTASAVSVGGATVALLFCTIVSSNTNAITGAGTFGYSQLTFNGSSSTMNTTTQVPNVQSNDAIKVVAPAAYPYTTTPQDALIKVDSSSARTITPLASPTTGQQHIIKDSVGSAGTNNITVTPSGKNIDGAASKVINTNYGSLTIVYTGTEWSII